ncbi:hypothetical protein [Candidatus Poriferisocius sp.]|uniref:hypothetical protein n=1 Tax=Candidatus Poriferisocius sp. TaxID=3101276 RepID=UPI003B02D1CC
MEVISRISGQRGGVLASGTAGALYDYGTLRGIRRLCIDPLSAARSDGTGVARIVNGLVGGGVIRIAHSTWVPPWFACR